MTQENLENQITRINDFMSHANIYRYNVLAKKQGYDVKLALDYLEEQAKRDWKLVGEIATPEEYIEAFMFERYWGDRR